MIVRVIGTVIGVSLILFILLVRGLPVLFFLKMIPLVLIFLVGAAFIYAGLTSD
jgi:hypothetical protein